MRFAFKTGDAPPAALSDAASRISRWCPKSAGQRSSHVRAVTNPVVQLITAAARLASPGTGVRRDSSDENGDVYR